MVHGQWVITGSTHRALRRHADRTGQNLSECLDEAIRAWVADIEQVRLLTTDPGTETADSPQQLPDTAAQDLRELSQDPHPDRLNLWLALLRRAGWNVKKVAAPVLGCSPEAAALRAKRGATLLNSPQAGELMTGLPPVPQEPAIPVAWQVSSQRNQLVHLDASLDQHLHEVFVEKTRREGLTQSQAVQLALSAYLETDQPEPPTL